MEQMSVPTGGVPRASSVGGIDWGGVPNANTGKWIAWGGGPCPVDPTSLVQYRTRIGAIVPAAGGKAAVEVRWSDTNKPHDVVAYRVVAEKPTPQRRSSDPKPATERKHNHYFKDVSHLDTIDVYRVIDLFGVTDPCLQHAIKKLLVPGGRGAKDATKDVQEAVDTLQRHLDMRAENATARGANHG